ncbi:D-hexose-6-phosphate mutarotase [Halieaceae bacterium IMCC14734]|uniref:Putative glucose-6-phosphate 1-epimerase n=1 Tax=Candidatus Litorirhabdus singularis TaxID=2518993 RepID=A0ABT3TEW1_9GAMM|nr:D-hexose-6-phosphate mutarotase [Candidatus Litorirhabdus singularis]MCX2980843.1 D-hexose-6-phosphate mutarotase [Candidatus Litorirhabdus singularis]
MQRLNEKFALDGEDHHLCVVQGKGGMPVIDIRNRFATAFISLQGAHVLSWTPEGQDDVLWLSEEARFAPGKSVRGGIPICWPWFGAHSSNSSLPSHGLARTAMWEILGTQEREDGSTRITFTLTPQPGNEQLWPAHTTLQYMVTIGKTLEMELVTSNNGADDITIGQALHTYFSIGNVDSVSLHGLDNDSYLDKLEGFARKHQRGPVIIQGEVDRVYIDTVDECVIEDKSLERTITINKRGSHSTVVWNPWKETAEKLGDMGEEGYKKMLCVETCNAADDVVTIAPGKAHHLWVQYQVSNTQ